MLIFCVKHLFSGSGSFLVRKGGIENYSRKYDQEIKTAAGRYGLPPALVKAVIMQESRFNPAKVGGKGEIGLMQLMPPGTAGATGEWARIHNSPPPSRNELFEVKCNLDIGCWYLARALKRWEKYDNAIELALVQYNAGPSRAKEFAPKYYSGGVIHRIKIASSKQYVIKVMQYYREFSQN